MQIVSYRIKKPDILLKIRKAWFWVSDNQHLIFVRTQLLSGYIYENKNSKVIGIKYNVMIVVCPTWYILLFIGLFLTPFHILISLCKWRLFLPFLMYFWECLVRSSLSEQSSYAIDTWMCSLFALEQRYYIHDLLIHYNYQHLYLHLCVNTVDINLEHIYNQ